MKKIWIRFLCLLLAWVCLVPTAVSASNGKAAVAVWRDISAQSFCLMDADTGVVLAQSDADRSAPMASTTKIMTCLVALEEGDPNAKVVIPRDAVGIEGSSVYLVAGEELTLLELIYATMLESANDAAVAIALHVSGSVPAFADEMNKKAEELGMTGSHFVNPNGLQADGHLSTARDLSLLMCSAMKNPLFAEISGTKTQTISAPEGKTRYLSNHNRLLRTYDGCVAGKTGFTKAAGRCLVTAACRDGKTLVCTTLGDPNDWRDHASLFDFGFSQYHKESIAEEGDVKLEIPVVGGTAASLKVTNVQGAVCSIREGETVSSYVELPTFVYAPVATGDALGEVVYTLGEQEIARIPLCAETSVDRREISMSFWQKLWKQFCDWLKKWKK